MCSPQIYYLYYYIRYITYITSCCVCVAFVYSGPPNFQLGGRDLIYVSHICVSCCCISRGWYWYMCSQGPGTYDLGWQDFICV